jgi:hypothetical protein
MDDSAFKSILDGFEATRTSLDHWLEFWTWLVVVGVAFELIFIVWDHLEEVGEWSKALTHQAIPFPSRPSRLKLLFEILSVALVVAGIVGELRIDVMLGRLETDIRDTNERRVLQLQKEAGDARDSAHDAAVDAGNAKADAGVAKTLATGARTEADALTGEIKSANQKAADAVSRLADAEQRLADSTQREAAAEAKLSAIKTPRSLIQTDELVTALKPLRGTEFTLNVFMDEESSNFTVVLAAALKEAGWVRKQPERMNIGIPTLGIQFDKDKENVPSCIETGVSIHAFTKESLPVLQGLPFTSLPKTVQAALTLKNALPPHISPSEDRNVADGVVDPRPQEGVPLIICVGKKP